jgi:hypothetical protein
MLNLTNKSKDLIEINKQLCLQLQNEIEILQEKLAHLDKELQMKKKNFSLVSSFGNKKCISR